MNFYMNMGNRDQEPIARGLYAEIAMIEEQHVTHYESLVDPLESLFQQEVFHQYNECHLYHSFLSKETDPKIKQIFELHLAMELEHLRIACELMRRYEGVEPEEILPAALPAPTLFESNAEYVRAVLEQQVDMRSVGTEFVAPADGTPPDSPLSLEYREAVNAGGVPTDDVIAAHREAFGTARSVARNPLTRARGPQTNDRRSGIATSAGPRWRGRSMSEASEVAVSPLDPTWSDRRGSSPSGIRSREATVMVVAGRGSALVTSYMTQYRDRSSEYPSDGNAQPISVTNLTCRFSTAAYDAVERALLGSLGRGMSGRRGRHASPLRRPVRLNSGGELRASEACRAPHGVGIVRVGVEARKARVGRRMVVPRRSIRATRLRLHVVETRPRA